MKRAAAWSLLSLNFVALAIAQTPLPLTLAEAERLAIANNPQLSASRFNSDAAAQLPLELHSAFQPTVTGAITAVGADGGSRLAAGGLNNPVVYNRLGTGFQVTQLLTDFGRTSNLVDSAKLHARAQDQLTQTTRAQILLTVARSFLGVLRAEAVLKVAQETVTSRQLVTDQVSALARSNLKSTLDVSFAEVNLADARLLLANAQSDVKSAYAELATAIGLPGQYDQGGFTLVAEPMPDPLPPTPDSLMSAALQDRPELAALRLDQDAAQRFAQAEKDLMKPTISVAAAVGVVPASQSQVPNRYGAVGVNISIPILNGHLFQTRRAEADLRAKAASENVKDLMNRIARDVRVAYLNSATAFDRLALTAQLLDQSKLALDLAQRRYDIGLGSIVELGQAQLNVTSAEIAGSSAQYNYQTRRAELSYQIGALR